MNRQILYALGRPLSPFYSLVMRWRETLYRKNILPVARLGVPVVSVGNLTMGGTGKTPVVHYIAELLRDRGLQPAVISRGYGGTASGRVNVVSDGRTVLMGAAEAGDEPRFLAENLDGVPVLTGARRVYPARHAVETGAGVLVLDDGFQHMALARDLDLVLFNADSLAGNSTVFPGGDLREPVRSMHRCHAFVVTGICERNRERAGLFRDLLRKRFPDHPVYLAEYGPVRLHAFGSDGWCADRRLDAVHDNPLFGFAGIARPEAFRQTVLELGYDLRGFSSLPDHARYDEQSLVALQKEAQKVGAVACITTEKDMVKLNRDHEWALPVYALQMRARFAPEFDEYIVASLGSATAA